MQHSLVFHASVWRKHRLNLPLLPFPSLSLFFSSPALTGWYRPLSALGLTFFSHLVHERSLRQDSQPIRFMSSTSFVYFVSPRSVRMLSILALSSFKNVANSAAGW